MAPTRGVLFKLKLFISFVIPAKAGIQRDKHLRCGQDLGSVPLVELLAIRLGCKNTPAKSLVIRRDYSINWIRLAEGQFILSMSKGGNDELYGKYFLTQQI